MILRVLLHALTCYMHTSLSIPFGLPNSTCNLNLERIVKKHIKAQSSTLSKHCFRCDNFVRRQDVRIARWSSSHSGHSCGCPQCRGSTWELWYTHAEGMSWWLMPQGNGIPEGMRSTLQLRLPADKSHKDARHLLQLSLSFPLVSFPSFEALELWLPPK